MPVPPQACRCADGRPGTAKVPTYLHLVGSKYSQVAKYLGM